MTLLERQIEGFRRWRDELIITIQSYQSWLERQGFGDIQQSLRIYDLTEALRHDRVTLAFLAEFSRGKTELINALFFSDFKRRLLPSDVGRTTMCPTEIFYDPDDVPHIRLLPIETRRSDESLASLRRKPVEWLKIRLNLESPEQMAQAMKSLTESKTVTLEEARELGLAVGAEGAGITTVVVKHDKLEIPAWRHALINYPHPLLKNGLVILDTPGLNALGVEPELTLSMIPHAHAVLFLLAMDTGVTRSDMEVWEKCVQRAVAHRIAVLNKIDLLWDELKSDEEIRETIQRQIENTAEILDLPRRHVLALSAQKALLAKIRNDEAMLEKSGIRRLERLLAEEIIPARLNILRAAVGREIGNMVVASRQGVRSELEALHRELAELKELAGQGREAYESLAARLENDKAGLRKVVGAFKNRRQELMKHGALLLAALESQRIDTILRAELADLEGSWTTAGLARGMISLLRHFREQTDKIAAYANRTKETVDSAYDEFHEKCGFPRVPVPLLDMDGYALRMQALEAATQAFCTDPINVMTEKRFLIRKFYHGLATEARLLFAEARQETESWLKGAFAPILSQIKRHEALLIDRAQSARKIAADVHSARDRFQELASRHRQLREQIGELDAVLKAIAAHPEDAEAARVA